MTFTKTITNSITLFGPAPSYWGNMQWGEKWGEGSEDLPCEIGKNSFLESVSISSTITPESRFNFTVSNSVVLSGDMYSEYMLDGGGYYYVFVKPNENAEQRTLATYAAVSPSSVSYTCLSVGSVTWS